jgi:hypothetical protein
MDIGMLWYDDTKKELSEKVARAVEYYKSKYGATPTLCFVNPSMLKEAELTETGGVQVRPARTVLTNHFWVGVGETAPLPEGKGAPRKKKMAVNA